ncbi:EamA family transporter [Sphingomonas daechungensis]|uniref:EamA family transporter n=1 Tax=Sphingomonas daechungensis TaxID=1176646 RepID=UPI003783A44F
MQPKVYVLIVSAVAMSAVGQMALKIAVERAHLKNAIAAGAVSALGAAAVSPALWAAVFIYVSSVALWLWALSEADLSTAYPFVSLGFVLTMVFAAVFLKEAITPLKLAGTLLILVGCVLVAKSA